LLLSLRTRTTPSSETRRNLDGACHAVSRRMPATDKRFVYGIRSEADPARHYTGITSNVAARLDWHNHGPSGCTVHNRPWSLVIAIEFRAEPLARRFEKYLKSEPQHHTHVDGHRAFRQRARQEAEGDTRRQRRQQGVTTQAAAKRDELAKLSGARSTRPTSPTKSRSTRR
jgi:putative endonuclease